MSLYYEAAASIEAARRANESIKAHIYASKELRSSPPQIFALVTQATKWSPILKGVIEKSELLSTERKVRILYSEHCVVRRLLHLSFVPSVLMQP